jgi:mono/diheme cytochrome c family protein
MTSRRTGLVAAVAFPLLLTACSGSKQPRTSAVATKSPAAGAKVFADAGCGSCHTLASAHSDGTVGPNLDQLEPDAATVARQVRNGGNGMPAFGSKLTAPQIAQVAAFVSSTSSASAAPALAFTPNGETIAACRRSTVSDCYRQAFGNVAYRSGPSRALALLATDSARIPGVEADCHQIAHTVGHAGLAYYKGNPAVALAHGAMTCNSGYYHGVIELAFAGVPRGRVTRVARRLCTGRAVTKEEFLLYQCVHGLGHGVMIYSGDDLPYSLKVCDRLLTSFDRISCTGGVFMQNVLPGMGTSRYLRADDPIYPCNAVAERHKLYCYLMVTARILEVDGYNWKKTAAWCRRSERGWVATCFQSFGRDASGATTYHPRQTVRLCLVAGPDAADCIYGASRDYANNYAGGPRSTGLCEAAPARYRGTCYRGTGTILGSIDAADSDRRAACRGIAPPRFRRDCLVGAGVL